MLGVGYDRSFGGRNFDEVLFNYLCDEFKTKYKIDIRTNARASLRMRIQCEKARCHSLLLGIVPCLVRMPPAPLLLRRLSSC